MFSLKTLRCTLALERQPKKKKNTHTRSEILLIPRPFPASSRHCSNLCGHGDSQSHGSKGEVAGMWSDDMLRITWIQRRYTLRKLSSYVLQWVSPLASVFLYVQFHPFLLLCTSFLPQLSFQTTGLIVFTQMPSNPRPSMPVHGECVCVCVPVREQLSHSAITCCTAETDRYSPYVPPSFCQLLCPSAPFLSQNLSNFLLHTFDNPSLLSLILLTSHFIPSVETE